MKRIILLTTEENDLVCDPFMGSGTTALACKEIKRNYIGFEISREYCDIADKRLLLLEK
jgi:site-specific DNA-methyltransferase (adenine-specific)